MPNPEYYDRYISPAEYHGQGAAQSAKFATPIAGDVTIQIDEFGECTLSLKLRGGELYSSRLSASGVSGSKAGSIEISEVYDFADVEIRVDCPEGIFTAFQSQFLGNQSVSDETGTVDTIRLRPQWMTFDAKGITDVETRYWLIPLINFISYFEERTPTLDGHPLTVRVKSGVLALIFDFDGQPAFIQPLPQYSDQVKKLRSRSVASVVSAVFVGARSAQPVDAVLDWIPVDILPLLGILTGSEVGLSWIELYNASGELVRCVYVNTATPTYLAGHAAAIMPNIIIDSVRSYLVSPLFGDVQIRVAMRHLSRAGLGARMLNDTLYQVCLALELISKYHHVDVVDLVVLLDNARQATVRNILQNTAQLIRAEMKVTPDPNEQATLDRISARVQSAGGSERSFALSLVELIRIFGLPDADIAGNHYQVMPTRHATWVGAVSYHRGAIAHSGYFETLSGQDSVSEAMALTYHLHDLAIRILFKMLGYTGPYQPSMMPPIQIFEEPVDWVQSNTPARALGYGR